MWLNMSLSWKTTKIRILLPFQFHTQNRYSNGCFVLCVILIRLIGKAPPIPDISLMSVRIKLNNAASCGDRESYTAWQRFSFNQNSAERNLKMAMYYSLAAALPLVTSITLCGGLSGGLAGQRWETGASNKRPLGAQNSAQAPKTTARRLKRRTGAQNGAQAPAPNIVHPRTELLWTHENRLILDIVAKRLHRGYSSFLRTMVFV